MTEYFNPLLVSFARATSFYWMLRKCFDQSSCACREETWRPIFVRSHSFRAMAFSHAGSKTRSISGAVPKRVQLKYVKLSSFARINIPNMRTVYNVIYVEYQTIYLYIGSKAVWFNGSGGDMGDDHFC